MDEVAGGIWLTSAILEQVLEQIHAIPSAKIDSFKEGVMGETRGRAWVPNPGPQTEAVFTQADELFYGGQAGGGKTDLIFGLALTEHQNSLILRRTNKEADKLPARLEEILGTDKGLNRQLGIWKVNKRQTIDLGGCQLEGDKQKRKGIPHDLKAFDEIADFSETQYTFISAWNRSVDPSQRCRIVCTGNPPTTAMGFWVIKRWAAWLDPRHPNPAKDGELRWYTLDTDTGKEMEVEGPGPHLINGEEIVARSRTFIRAALSDNPDLAQTNYDSVLAALPERERLAYREGLFSASMVDQLGQAIPTDWVQLAQDRWTSKPEEAIPMCAIGVDCTGGGKDPMVMAPRYDAWFAPLIEIPGREFDIEKMGQQAAGHVVAVRRNKALVVIDLGGGYGSSTYEQLRENEIECYGYKGSESFGGRARDSKLAFRNTRSAAIWRFREALDPSQPGGSDIALPDDAELVADLTSPTYEVVSGKICIESKEHVCERLGRSTDKGDAVVMCWFQGPRHETNALEFIETQQRHRKRGQAPKVIMRKRR